ncbi:MAG: alpha-hydroxy acid oxidase [Gordonia sp. (in: high G+C Gram-positive bacteria)]
MTDINSTAFSFVPFTARSEQEQRIITEYIESGAGDGGTVRANEAAWSRFSIIPRVLRTSGLGDTTVRLLGQSWASPVVVAPSIGHGFFAADAEVATARAAVAAGSPVALSHGAAAAIEDVAQIASPYLQQVYVPKDRAAVVPFIERSAAAGAAAFLITVDNQAPGGHAPYRTNAHSLVNALIRDTASRGIESGLANDLSIRDIEWFASLTDVPILAKGVLDARDARDIVNAGAAGVVVSNHGGRQVERSVTAADVLADIRAAVGPESILLADGGIRRPSDVFVALALGADAVLVGRPVLRALQHGGEQALTKYLREIRDDLAELLASAGRQSLSDIGSDAIRLT